MELNGKLLDEVIDIFRKVEWGEITFRVSPVCKALDYCITTTGKLHIEERQKQPLPEKPFLVK